MILRILMNVKFLTCSLSYQDQSESSYLGDLRRRSSGEKSSRRTTNTPAFLTSSSSTLASHFLRANITELTCQLHSNSSALTMLYTNATIITVDATRRIIADGTIRVEGDRIADIGKTSLLKERYPNDEEHDLSGRIIIPGLISTHMHTAQTLLRGTADDLELVSWLCERIWVLQGNFTEEDGYAAARLSIGEMLKSGTTCFLESMVRDLEW